MQLSYELQLQRPGKGILGPASELPVNGGAVNADLNCRFERTDGKWWTRLAVFVCLRSASPHLFFQI